MKRKIILSICALTVAWSLCLTTAMAKGGGGRPTPSPTPSQTVTTPTPAPVTYDHVDVRTAGRISLTQDGKTKEYPLTVTSVRVFVGETELLMTGPHKSESRSYPQEFRSARGLLIAEGAEITVSCAFSYKVAKGDVRTGTGSFAFTTADTNCESSNKRGVDLTIIASLVEQIATPTPSASAATPTPSASAATPTPSASAATPTPSAATPTPSVSPTPTPTVAPTPTPTPTPNPTPTPRYVLPQTGETADMWTVMLVLTGLCAVTGAVLLILRRANRQ